ncbi:Protein of unknown function [Pyronema omphalodes CBS 100304]|uniref:Uncharacterized protein n=1 Tax=Pyronema omphalodes (strain CBS 100304) TaxID=1076935 RepID=U4L725_PYROM|nr:Protein of unknown function [Pyronema omphalodes CBS 100304]
MSLWPFASSRIHLLSESLKTSLASFT